MMWSLAVLAIIGAVLGALLVGSGDAKEKEFMAECLQHEARYRCTAMWRAGTTPAAAPSPILYHPVTE